MRHVAAAVILTMCLCAPLVAHHSGSEYDRTTVEIEGTLVELVWRNPHVHFGVRTIDASGKTVVWDIEANSLSILSRTDANPSNLKLGDRIKVAGAPSRQTPNKLAPRLMQSSPAHRRKRLSVVSPNWVSGPGQLTACWIQHRVRH